MKENHEIKNLHSYKDPAEFLPDISTQKLNKYLKQGLVAVEKAKGKSLVLSFGVTGSGKTTLTNCLAGEELVYGYTKDYDEVFLVKGEDFYIQQIEQLTDYIPSITRLPIVLYSVKEKVFYCAYKKDKKIKTKELNIESQSGLIKDHFADIVQMLSNRDVEDNIDERIYSGSEIDKAIIYQFLCEKGVVFPKRNNGFPGIGFTESSKTLVPNIVEGEHGYFYCDLPGILYENRGIEEQMANSILTEMVVRQAASIKAILIIVSYAEFSAAKGEAFSKLTEMLSRLFVKFKEVKPVVQLVITKIPGDAIKSDKVKAIVLNRLTKKCESLTNELNEIKQNLEAWENQIIQSKSEDGLLSMGIRFFSKKWLPPKNNNEKNESQLHQLRQIFFEKEKTYFFLEMLIKNGEEKIFNINYQDPDLRKRFYSTLEGMDKSIKIDHKWFDFNIEGLRNSFENYLVAIICNANTFYVMHEYISQQISQVDKDIIFSKDKIRKIKNDQLNDLVQLNKNEIDSISTQIAKVTTEMNSNQLELTRFDVTSEIDYGKQKVTKKDLNFFDKWTFKSKTFRINGVPFKYAVTNCQHPLTHRFTGTFLNRDEDKEAGRFTIKYESNIWEKEPYAEVYLRVKQCDLPQNRNKIIELKESYEINKYKLEELQGRKDQLTDTITQLERNRDNVNYKIQHNDQFILLHEEERLDKLNKCRKDYVADLKEHQEFLLKNYNLNKLAVNLCEILSIYCDKLSQVKKYMEISRPGVSRSNEAQNNNSYQEQRTNTNSQENVQTSNPDSTINVNSINSNITDLQTIPRIVNNNNSIPTPRRLEPNIVNEIQNFFRTQQFRNHIDVDALRNERIRNISSAVPPFQQELTSVVELRNNRLNPVTPDENPELLVDSDAMQRPGM